MDPLSKANQPALLQSVPVAPPEKKSSVIGRIGSFFGSLNPMKKNPTTGGKRKTKKAGKKSKKTKTNKSRK
jgi:hypothetical protein